MTDVYFTYSSKQTNLWLACVQCTVLPCVKADMCVTFESLCFQSKGARHQWQWVTQVIQPLRMSLLQFPQSSVSRRASRLLAEMVQLHRLFQLELDHYPNFLRVPQRCQHPPDNRKQPKEHSTHIPKRWGGCLGHLLGYRCLSSFRRLVTNCYLSWSGIKLNKGD